MEQVKGFKRQYTRRTAYNPKSLANLTATGHGKWRTPAGTSGLKTAYRKYKIGAGQRGIAFDLTLEQFKEIVDKPCYYCGSKPSLISYCTKQRTQEAHNRSKYTHSGVDRVDNLIGYTQANCVPCCTQCNRAKGSLTMSDFKEYLDQLVDYRSKLCPR